MKLSSLFQDVRFLILILLLVTDIAVILDIPVIRQITGFIFLVAVPGIFILHFFQIHDLDRVSWFVYVVGLSIVFLLIAGLLYNNALLLIPYKTPFAEDTFLLFLNALCFLALVSTVKSDFSVDLSFLRLSPTEKMVLIPSLIILGLSISGAYLLNSANNNDLLLLQIALIVPYVFCLCVIRYKIPVRMYPVVLVLLSLSLLLPMSLRSAHLIGVDTHLEYYTFMMILKRLHWGVYTGTQLDSCLSISILPMLFEAVIKVPTEYLFKLLYPILFSIQPLAIFLIARKYFDTVFAFITGLFMAFQPQFLATTLNARTSMAILCVTLLFLTMFHQKIERGKKKILLLVFFIGVLLSHYSTTYLILAVLFIYWVILRFSSKEHKRENSITIDMLFAFSLLTIVWYVSIVPMASRYLFIYVEKAIANLDMLFSMEARSGSVQTMLGSQIVERGIPTIMQFALTWTILLFIGLGLIKVLLNYQETTNPDVKFYSILFLKKKLDVSLIIIAVICTFILFLVVALPFVSLGYDSERFFYVMIIILSVFFVLGGVSISENLIRIKQFTKQVLHPGNPSTKSAFALLFPGIYRGPRIKAIITRDKDNSQMIALLIILSVLLLYFLCATGFVHQIYGYQRDISLSSEGKQYDSMFIHDTETASAQWLKGTMRPDTKIYSDGYGFSRLMSQGLIDPSQVSIDFMLTKEIFAHRYVYLRYLAVQGGSLQGFKGTYEDIQDYYPIFSDIQKIYTNGGSEILAS